MYADALVRKYVTQEGMEADYVLCDHLQSIILFRRLHMRGKFFIEIPYRDRAEYVSLLLEIRNLVDENGLIFLAVNNNPYILESYLIVATDTNVEKITHIINKNDLMNYQRRGIKEIVREIGSDMWKMVDIPSGATAAQMRRCMNTVYDYSRDMW